jgi:hypothetical protein
MCFLIEALDAALFRKALFRKKCAKIDFLEKHFLEKSAQNRLLEKSAQKPGGIL